MENLQIEGNDNKRRVVVITGASAGLVRTVRPGIGSTICGNLYRAIMEPIGTFAAKSKSFSIVTWASLHKGAVAASLLLFAGAIFLVNKSL